MHRIHIALGVDDLDATIRDDTDQLGVGPIVVVPGTDALWRTAEANLSVSSEVGRTERLRHIGFRTRPGHRED